MDKEKIKMDTQKTMVGMKMHEVRLYYKDKAGCYDYDSVVTLYLEDYEGTYDFNYVNSTLKTIYKQLKIKFENE